MTKVSIVRCRGYEQDKVDKAARRSVELVCDLKKIVKRGDRVLIKPNMLSAHPPEEGVCTHPSVVKATIKLVKEVGGIPLVGDSPGAPFDRVEEVYRISGIQEAALEAGAQMIHFHKEGIVEVPTPDSKFFKSLHIARPALEADVLINLPKWKTHGDTTLTGAVKNLFGVIPGMRKSEFHRRAPKSEELGDILCDILSVVKPDLTIMDGVVGMEGDGPAYGHLRNIGLILASLDPVSLDVVFALLVGLQPLAIPTTKAAVRRNLGVGDLRKIEVVGESLERVEVKDFRLPVGTIAQRAPKFLVKIVTRAMRVRPIIDKRKCEACEVCLEGCPVAAITMEKNYPKIDYRKCIECFCCHELCPNGAVKLKPSLLGRVWA